LKFSTFHSQFTHLLKSYTAEESYPAAIYKVVILAVLRLFNFNSFGLSGFL